MVKSGNYKTRFGRHLVGFKIITDWEVRKIATGENIYKRGPIVKAWVVDNNCAHPLVSGVDKNDIELLLRETFKTQNKSASFIAQFFSDKTLSDEEKMEIDSKEEDEKPVMIINVETDAITEPTAEETNEISLDENIPSMKWVKKKLVAHGIMHEFDVDMTMTKETVLDIINEPNADEKIVIELTNAQFAI